ncbi:Protein kinase domain-containing protein [Mycena kentingensis (nom. inval.)]|nr:Protein kinase domain-containing protein [Mycena kentingensis (nom. inval.)]
MPLVLTATSCAPSMSGSVPPVLCLETSPGTVASVFPTPFEDFTSVKAILSALTSGAHSARYNASPGSSLNEKRPSESSRPPKLSRKVVLRRPAPAPTDLQTHAPGPFVFLRNIQSGTFGDAIAVRELHSNRVLCLKVMNKKTAIRREQLPGIVQEILAYRSLSRGDAGAGAAFVMDLEASLQDEHRLYLVMELMDCDLLSVLEGYRYCVPENAKRWLCQMSLGIAAIHAHGVIHRDIKPENILLDFQGNIRITDFGAAHTLMPTSDSTAAIPHKKYSTQVWGTYIYMAPEMLANRNKPREQRRRYGLAVDYWGLGCVAFELLCGLSRPTPLFPEDIDFDAYLAWPRDEPYPAFTDLDEDVQSLLYGLLDLDPKARFRIEHLRGHPFFQNADGDSEFDLILRSPPPLRHQATLEDVGANIDDVPRHLINVSLSPPESADTFRDFGWLNPRDVPNELWIGVLKHLTRSCHLSVYAVSARFRALARPFIFDTVRFTNSSKFPEKLEFWNREDISSLVQTVQIRGGDHLDAEEYLARIARVLPRWVNAHIVVLSLLQCTPLLLHNIAELPRLQRVELYNLDGTHLAVKFPPLRLADFTLLATGFEIHDDSARWMDALDRETLRTLSIAANARLLAYLADPATQPFPRVTSLTGMDWHLTMLSFAQFCAYVAPFPAVEVLDVSGAVVLNYNHPTPSNNIDMRILASLESYSGPADVLAAILSPPFSSKPHLRRVRIPFISHIEDHRRWLELVPNLTVLEIALDRVTHAMLAELAPLVPNLVKFTLASQQVGELGWRSDETNAAAQLRAFFQIIIPLPAGIKIFALRWKIIYTILGSKFRSAHWVKRTLTVRDLHAIRDRLVAAYPGLHTLVLGDATTVVYCWRDGFEETAFVRAGEGDHEREQVLRDAGVTDEASYWGMPVSPGKAANLR